MNAEQIMGKKVLMFCASFFGYDKRISSALEDAGYEVDLIDEKPSCSFIAKACVRYNVSLYRPVIRKYISSVITQREGKQYDYVLVVKGEAINEEAVALLRKAYPKAYFILYLWDSVANIPDCENRMALYDKVLTFDPVDAKKYKIPYISIPYGKENTWCEQTKMDCKYDIAFIGTAHSIRPRVVKQIEEICKAQGRKMFVYFYSPHILVYALNKLCNSSYRWIKMREVHFEALSNEEVCQIYRASKCILDIEHPKQHGTTTRPVEMLSMKKKIITTNTHVYDFPFYDSHNFYIIDREKPDVDISFLDSPYSPVDDEIVKQYSPSQFVKALMGSQA